MVYVGRDVAQGFVDVCEPFGVFPTISEDILIVLLQYPLMIETEFPREGPPGRGIALMSVDDDRPVIRIKIIQV